MLLVVSFATENVSLAKPLRTPNAASIINGIPLGAVRCFSLVVGGNVHFDK